MLSSCESRSASRARESTFSKASRCCVAASRFDACRNCSAACCADALSRPGSLLFLIVLIACCNRFRACAICAFDNEPEEEAENAPPLCSRADRELGWVLESGSLLELVGRPELFCGEELSC